MRTRRKVRGGALKLLLMSFAGVVTACGVNGGGRELGLLDGKESTRVTRDAEQARLHRMQMVRVLDDVGGIHEVDPKDFISAVRESCEAKYPHGLPDPCHNMIDSGQVRGEYCQGEIFLSIASSLDEVVLEPTNPLKFRTRVLPQSSSTNASLAIAAYESFAVAFDNVARYAANVDSDCGNEDYPAALESRADEIGALFIDSYHQARAALELSVKYSVAVADAEMSSTPMLGLGATRTTNGRMAAAHLLVGGSGGLHGRDQPFCSSATLSAHAKSALSALRASGISPSQILATKEFIESGSTVTEVPIEVLLDETNESGSEAGSVRQRLEDYLGVTIPSNFGVAEYLGLDLQDFVEARRYLAEEIRAFSRSMTAVLVNTERAGQSNTPTYYKHYAAVASTAPERAPAFFEALARFKDPHDPNGSQGVRVEYWDTGMVPDEYFHLGSPGSSLALPAALSQFVDWGQTWTRYLVRQPDLSSNATLRSGIIGPATLLASSDERTGRFVLCSSPNSTQEFYVDGSDDKSLIVVAGNDALECAVSGSVEGAPCDSSFITVTLDKSSGTDAGFDSAVMGCLSLDGNPAGCPVWSPHHLGEQWYVLKPKVAGAGKPGPGGWIPVIGFTMPATLPAPSSTVCTAMGILPDVAQRVADAIQPSRQWCTASSTTCAGTRFDERLPLEDELAQDDNGVESSWKHYLTLARQAATQSDALGEEYINAGLAQLQEADAVQQRGQQQAEKAAAELEQVQDICGTEVDVSTLIAAMSSLASLDQGSCTSPMPTGTTCIEGRAIKDWKKQLTDPALAKVADCLASFDDTIAYLQLGDANICLWKEDSTGKICGGASGVTCPSLQDENANRTCPHPTGTTAFTVVAPDDSLGFFSTKATLPPTAGANLCDSIRRLRLTPGDETAIGEIRNSNIFNWGTLKSLREAVDFVPAYNSHLTLKAGPRTFTTGTPTGGGNNNQWPCGVEGARACGASGTGLFCFHQSCDTPQHRQIVNERLARAVMAAKLTTFREGATMPKFDMPVTVTHSAKPRYQNEEPTFYIGTVPINSYSNASWRIFEANAAGDAAIFHSLGMASGTALTVTGFGSAQRRGFYRHEPSTIPALFDDFWADLADGANGEGYFAKRLKGVGHAEALPASAKAISLKAVPYSLHCPDNNVDVDCDGWKRSALKRMDLDATDLADGVVIDGSDVTFEFDDEALLDGLELLCEANQAATGVTCDLEHAPRLDSLDNLSDVGDYLKCLGNQVQRDAGLVVFTGIPTSAVAVMRQQAADRTYSPTPGQLGAAISELRSALLQVSIEGPAIGATIRNFGEDMRSLKAAMLKSYNTANLADLQFYSNDSEQTARCASSLASTGGSSTWVGFMASTISAGFSCVNSLAQISLADRIRDLSQKNEDLDRDALIADFNRRFTSAVATLEERYVALQTATEAVARQTGIVRSLQQKVRNSIDKAVWLLSSQSPFVGPINSVLGARQETVKARYERAHDNAVRLTYLAKRAIEQRLGMRLADMRQDFPLVEAPATWEAKLCTSSGVDFEKLAAGAGPTADGGKASVTFADAYIGDYVTKLENVVESYRLVHNFHEGQDVAVISLRDDVLNVRRECDVDSKNKLYYSTVLDHMFGAAQADEHSWFVDGCKSGAGACIGVTPQTDAPIAGPSPDLVDVRGYALEFGDGAACHSGTCTWQPGAAYVQSVHLAPGRYLYSWFAKAQPDTPGSVAGYVRIWRSPAADAGSADAGGDGGGTVDAGARQGTVVPVGTPRRMEVRDTKWSRYYYTFDVGEASEAVVGFTRANTGSIEVAAPMLEQVESTVAPDTLAPRPFAGTKESLVVSRAVCEDTDGAVFRASRWRRGCLQLCPDGYSSNCASRARTECYRELSFQIGQRGFEEGAILNQSGFAKGNFNYRIEQLGLNFVGTAVRDCSDSLLPSSCYGAGFASYSLDHLGPYLVRNDSGDDFRAELFTGHVEHARGLASERYITNPLSQNDKSLVDPYMRAELQGRPLDGTFVLRVWEDEGINFQAIKDVQLVLKYRYWTRFN